MTRWLLVLCLTTSLAAADRRNDDLVVEASGTRMAFMKGARVVPAMKDGKPAGMKLYAIRPSSPYAKLGFANGDTVKAINTHVLTSPYTALEPTRSCAMRNSSCSSSSVAASRSRS